MKNEVTVNVQGAKPGEPVIIHILEGAAPDKPLVPSKVIVSGDIHAVSSYIEIMESELDKKKAVIIFKEDDLSITLQCDPSSPIGAIVTAKHTKYPELEAFGINKSKYFNRAEIEKLIRMNRIFFYDKDFHKTLLAQVSTFAAKVQSEVNSMADNRGNKTANFNKQVTSDLAADFMLKIPIFKGEGDSTFRVEICYDVSEAAVRFWLESVELFEVEKSILLSSFDKYKSDFQKKKFVVINA